MMKGILLAGGKATRFRPATQAEPGGIAQAFLIARHFIGKERVCLLLGDNIFLNAHPNRIAAIAADTDHAYVLTLPHGNPSQYGVISCSTGGSSKAKTYGKANRMPRGGCLSARLDRAARIGAKHETKLSFSVWTIFNGADGTCINA